MQSYFASIISKATDKIRQSVNSEEEINDTKIQNLFDNSIVEDEAKAQHVYASKHCLSERLVHPTFMSKINDIGMQHKFLSLSVEGQAKQLHSIEQLVRNQTEQIKTI